jgi:hypothetical protein
MSGTDRVRQCPQCKALAFKLDGLTEDQATSLLGGSEEKEDQRRLSRRADGTFVSYNMPCGISAWKSALKRWPAALRLVLGVLFVRGGMFGALAMALVACQLHSLAYLAGVTFLAIVVNRVALTANGLNAREIRKRVSMATETKSVCGLMVYYLAATVLCCYVPMMLLVAPIISLGPVIVSLRSMNPIEAGRESFKLSRTAIPETIAYQSVPIVFAVMVYCIFDLVIYKSLANYFTQHEIMTHLLVVGIRFVGLFATAVIALTLVPMQVELYHLLQWRQDSKSKLLPLSDRLIKGSKPPSEWQNSSG